MARFSLLLFIVGGFVLASHVPSSHGRTLSAFEKRLCRSASLRRFYWFCRYYQSSPTSSQGCSYSPWSAWQPTGAHVRAYNCPGLNGMQQRRARTLRRGTTAQCGGGSKLSATRVKCAPSVTQQVSILQNALGVGFGTSPAPSSTSRIFNRAPGPIRRLWGGRRRRRRPVWTPPKPRVTRHIAIVMDGSGSVGRHNFRVAAQDLASIFGHLCYKWTRYNQPSDVRLAFVIYSGSNLLVFNFQHSAYRHTSLRSIVNDIENAGNRYPGGATFTGEALRYAYNNIFTPDLLRRYPSSQKRLLIITDGRSTGTLNPGREARRLHIDRNVAVYPVGIGNSINMRELRDMHQAENSQLANILLLNNFRELSQIRSAIVSSHGHCKNVLGR